MSPLQYHNGQLEVQQEANSRHVADKLAHWVGPVARYALNTDLVLLATVEADRALHFAAVSGPPPLVSVAGPGTLRLHETAGQVLQLDAEQQVGGLVISLARAERARINGVLRPANGGLELEATELFTLCRKYMAPTSAANVEVVGGPVSREAVDLADAWATALLAAAETTFLASVSPQGMPDVAHRGGPPGFLEVDTEASEVRWTEFVGDGVFKSAGNVRATGVASFLVPDLASGDALELTGHASYETLRFERRPREDPLVRFRDPFPTQGRMTLRVESAARLRGLAWPRARLVGERVTSQSSVDDQAPTM